MSTNQQEFSDHVASDQELDLKWQALEQGQRVFFRPGEVPRIMNRRKAKYEADKLSKSNTPQPPPQ